MAGGEIDLSVGVVAALAPFPVHYASTRAGRERQANSAAFSFVTISVPVSTLGGT